MEQNRHSDLIVVGAGIVGLAHAYEAHRQGLSVRIIERDARPNGASIRNFGHCCITAQGGEQLEMSYRSRAGWLDAAKDVGFWAPEAGAVSVARTEAELRVLEEFASARGSEAAQLLTAAQVRERLGRPGADPRIVGGAFLPADLRVDPRVTAPAIADWLQAQDGVEIEWRTTVGHVADGVVSTSRGEFTASDVFVCVNHDMDYLYPELADRWQVRRCALQMALASPVAGWSLDSAVISGTSLVRYDGFGEMPGIQAVRDELRAQTPELVDMGANVMFTRRPDGTVILGDSHVYGATIGPFNEEWISDRLVDEIGSIMGEKLNVVQRWQGIYASSALTNVVDERVDDRTRVISVTSGIGMTLSFGLAARSFALV
ncbi:MAG: TIGR03364 family FAD-dependent oxidoreductase [Arthrobacter sp.]|jgi:FAD dependent oxidoreductase TIGR03364|nr:TIGR03364 family FAD-dependent oxidoreductase [Arthrobacter sp.]